MWGQRRTRGFYSCAERKAALDTVGGGPARRERLEEDLGRLLAARRPGGHVHEMGRLRGPGMQSRV